MLELGDIVSMKVFINYSRLNLRKHFFMNRVVQMWNSLPEEVVWAPSLSAFKACLDIHWAEIGYGGIERPSYGLTFSLRTL